MAPHSSIGLRKFHQSDIESIDNIWRKHHSDDFSIPNRNNSIIDAVVEEDGKVIAYGQVKMFAEAMFIIDKDASTKAKVTALKLLMVEAFRGTNIVGIEDLYCFIKDPQFSTLISKHFGFEIVDEPGELLLRKV